ncbi:MAG: 4a-hydroxytetrahydrobiopterin dehydratase [Planctomycetes bacterium]|nr:4a-hydroxytetrahydrobiopterin dehydratase [Planctomycetota bacterium]
MPEALLPTAIAEVLLSLPDWSGDINGLRRTYRFADFKAAMAFMQTAAVAIDAANHHPEWSNVYNRVDVTLRTHDAGDRVTELDIKLARLLDMAAEKSAPAKPRAT